MEDVNSKNKECPLLTIIEIRLNIHIVHLQCEISRSSYKLGFSSFMWHCVIGSVAPYITLQGIIVNYLTLEDEGTMIPLMSGTTQKNSISNNTTARSMYLMAINNMLTTMIFKLPYLYECKTTL